jgi:hypothetical protein
MSDLSGHGPVATTAVERGWLVTHPILGVTVGTAVLILPMALVVAALGLRGAPLGVGTAGALVAGWGAGYWKLKSITPTES